MKSLTVDRVLKFLILSIPFSLWPAVNLGIIGINKNLRIYHLAGLLVIALFAKYLWNRHLLITPLKSLVLWYLYLFFVALLSTSMLSRTLVEVSTTGYTLILSLIIYALLASKKINLKLMIGFWLMTAVVVSVHGLLQFWLGSFDTFVDIVGLSAPHRPIVFSWPRPHSAFLESQFFAGFLLLPLAYTLVLFNSSFKYKLLNVFFLVLILLSMSRGAFVGTAVIYLVFYGYSYVGKELKSALLSSTGVVAALSIALASIGLTSALNGTGAINGVDRFLDHSTHEVIDIQSDNQNKNSEGSFADKTSLENFNKIINKKEVDTEGVVEDSTYGRLATARFALESFFSSTRYLIFGFGLAQFGEISSELQPDIFSINSVVNSQPVETVVESGIVGLSLLSPFLSVMITVAHKTLLKKSGAEHLAVSLAFTGLVVHFAFFSSRNLLYFWLVIAMMLYIHFIQQRMKSYV